MPTVKNELVNAVLAAFEKDGDINVHEHPIHGTYRDGLRLEGEV